jgi:hypothetical protein
LRELSLRSVRTQLPWRNMNNLTSLTLILVSQPTVSLGQILDFFESAPRLSEVTLTSAAPTVGAQDGRLVSLSHLRKLIITGQQPSSLLLNHLVIPVGAEAAIYRDSLESQIDDLLPKSLNNFQNLSNISRIDLEFGWFVSCMRITGPDGGLSVASRLGPDPTHLVTCALERLDTSSTQCLDIKDDNCMTNELHGAILSMANLRTLNISRENDSPSFLRDLDLALASDGVIACPKLEELTYNVSGKLNLGILVDFAAARASRRVPLKSVEVFSGEPLSRVEVSELGEYVSHVETGVGGNGSDQRFFEDIYDDEDSDEEGWGELW